MQGGGSAPLCKTEYVRQDGVTEELPGKIEFPLKSGEQLRYWTTGSGGYGSALQRDPDHVLNDVLDGRVSNKAAYDNYGVVLDGNEINKAATTELRTKMETSV